MFFNNRKTIGIFISNINNEYQEFLCEGISRRAQELGYNAIFSLVLEVTHKMNMKAEESYNRDSKL